MYKFSPELVARLQKYFAQRYDVQLSDEQAEMYLDSLAKLFQCGVQQAERAAGADACFPAFVGLDSNPT